MVSPPADNSPAPELAGRLRLATARLARQLRLQAGTGLSASQHSALATIEVHGPLTLGDLAAREQVAPPTITKVVGRLEDDGLVDRTTDARDRRVCLVSITGEGRRRLDRSRARRDAALATRLEQLSRADLERLAGAIDVLEAIAQPAPATDETEPVRDEPAPAKNEAAPAAASGRRP
ncbi:MAG TPA: MarR family transcriptional regulator [Acidimicrobiales bacterium]